jgi:hypothetical protein
VESQADPEEALLQRCGVELADRLVAELGNWVRRCVELRAAAAGVALDENLAALADDAARTATAAVIPEVRALLARDIDEQGTTPLQLVRAAIVWPTEVLRSAGVAPVDRDAFSLERFPGDVYDLTPATMADIDPGVGEAAIAWGAAKAWVHRRRHSA